MLLEFVLLWNSNRLNLKYFYLKYFFLKNIKILLFKKLIKLKKDGASILVDSRNFVLPNYEKGFFLGATLIELPKSMYQYSTVHEEIFEPVMNVLLRNY